jgi:hypothetical protein
MAGTQMTTAGANHHDQPKVICGMTSQQADLKRASDRMHQRYSRARRKAHMDELVAKNVALTDQLAATEEKLKLLQDNYDALRTAINGFHTVASEQYQALVVPILEQPPQYIKANLQTNSPTPIQSISTSPSDLPEQGDSSVDSSLQDCKNGNTVVIDNFLFDLPIELGTGLMVNFFNSSLNQHDPFGSLPEACESWPVGNLSPLESNLEWANSSGLAAGAMLAIEQQFEALPHQEFAQPPIWQRLPINLAPTTAIDHVLIEVSESGRKSSPQRGKIYEELCQQSFPSISSLLNLTNDDAASHPVSAAVGKHAMWGTTVLSFSSRVAYHYIVAHMVRWLVCRTEESFAQLPDFLKPTELQRKVPHPAWVEVFPW